MEELKNEIEKYFPKEACDIIRVFNQNKISEFRDFLQLNNEIGGFFSKKDSEDIFRRHILESIYHIYRITKELSVSRETKLADVGTGPGLPGFLFFCLKEFPKITLIDSQKRKLALLEKYCIDKFNKQIHFLYDRAEEIRSEKFDFVVTRSSIPFPWSVEICSRLVKMNGFFIPFLGKLENMEKNEKYLSDLGFQIEKIIYLEELSFLGNRNVLFLKKIQETPKRYPRIWKNIKKEMRHNGENHLN